MDSTHCSPTCLSIPWRESPEGIILAAHQAGFGDRLKVILNALHLSQKLKLGFGFTWMNSTRSKEHEKMPPAEKIFSKDFIDKYHIPSPVETASYPKLPNNLLRSDGPCKTLELTNNKGWQAPFELSIQTAREASSPQDLSFHKLFKQIGFHDNIEKLYQHAHSVNSSKNYTALHLRAGDIMYGATRKSAKFSNKLISAPIAKAIIKNLQSKQSEVIVFGQDDKFLDSLKHDFGITLAKDFEAPEFSSNTELAIYEMALMSRCKDIISGDSSFAIIASIMSGCPQIEEKTLYTAKEATQITLDDLDDKSNVYHPLQISSAYWNAYYNSHKQQTHELNNKLLASAYRHDPENQLYALARSCEFFKRKKYRRGEKVLEELMENEYCQTQNKKLPCIKVFIQATHKNIIWRMYLPYLEQAVKKNKPYAMILFSEFAFRHDGGNKLYRTVLRNAASLINPDSEYLRSMTNTKSNPKNLHPVNNATP